MAPTGADLFERLDALLGVGLIERARELVSAAIAAQPDDPSAHQALAVLRLVEGKPDDALAAIDESLRLAPGDDDAHLLRARIFLALGRWAEAELACRGVLARDPDRVEACTLYARLLALLDYPAEGLKFVERALAISPSNAALHALRGRLLLVVPSSSWTASAESARTALALDPEDTDAAAVLGLVLLRDGRHEEAEDHLAAVLSRDPDNRLALFGLAEVMMTRNPLYRPLLSFSLWMSGLSETTRLGVAIGLWVVYSGAAAALRASGMGVSADRLFWIYLAFCAWTWFARSITRWVMSFQYPWLGDT